MTLALLLEVIVVIVRDKFRTVPPFSVQDISKIKPKFLHKPISLGGAMVQVGWARTPQQP